MDLTAQSLHRQLDLIADQGWDGPVAAQLLRELRTHVVRPVVRAARLHGPAADQAESTAWAAAWEAIRRPSARSAENPGGMVWMAVRRSVVTEVQQTIRSGTPVGDARTLDYFDPADAGTPVWVDHCLDPRSIVATHHLRLVIDLLVTVGWERPVIEDVMTLLADVGTDGPGWRSVARRLGLPAWQVRRVALLVVMGPTTTLLELVVRHGAAAVGHPAAGWAARSTLSHWQSGPEQSLEQLGWALAETHQMGWIGGARSTDAESDRLSSTVDGSAQGMGVLR